MRGRGVWSLGASVLGQLFYLGILLGYPLVNKQFAIEHGLVEIVDLPINSMGGSFHSFLLPEGTIFSEVKLHNIFRGNQHHQ